MRAWTSVKVTNPDLARHGQAGQTTEQTPDDAKEVEVKFDTPDPETGETVTEVHKVSDLQVL